MKKLAHTLLAAGALFAAAATSHAQTAPRIAVVDVEKIFNQHYETQAEKAKLDTQQKAAQKDLDGLQKQITELLDQAKALQEQGNNPTMTAEAKKKTQDDFQVKVQELNTKRQEALNFRNQALGSLQQTFAQFRTQLLEQIVKQAQAVSKDHGATILLNNAMVLQTDPSYDITDEVIAAINKNRPAGTPAASASSSPSSEPVSASPSSTPTFSVPNVTPGK